MRRRERVEQRQLLKGLCHGHEHIQIERRHRRDDANPAPRPGEVIGVQRGDRHRERHQRYDADHVRWQQLPHREQEAGHAGEHRGRKENSAVQESEPLPFSHPNRTTNQDKMPIRLSAERGPG